MRDYKRVSNLAYGIRLFLQLIDEEEVEFVHSNSEATVDLKSVSSSKGVEIIKNMLGAFVASCDCNEVEASSMMKVVCIQDEEVPYFTSAMNYDISIESEKLGFKFQATVYGTGLKPNNCSLIEIKRTRNSSNDVNAFLDKLGFFADEFSNMSQFA